MTLKYHKHCYNMVLDMLKNDFYILSADSKYHKHCYNMVLDMLNTVMLWLPNFLPRNFAKELEENDHNVTYFLCKIVPLLKIMIMLPISCVKLSLY